jgi:hypothetical protein
VNRARPARAQPREEALHGGRVTVPAHPHHPAAAQVVDDREVVLSLAAADLIEADDVQRVPAPVLQAPEHRAFDHGGNGLPVHAEVVGHRAPRQLACQGGDGPRQRVRYPLPLVRPRHAFDPQAALRALYAGGGVHQLDLMLAQRQIAPAPGRAPRRPHLLSLSPAPPAAQTPVAHASQMNDQRHTLHVLLDALHPMGFQSQGFPDKRFHDPGSGTPRRSGPRRNLLREPHDRRGPDSDRSHDAMPARQDVQGLLGGDFLRNFRVTVDRSGKLLILEVP